MKSIFRVIVVVPLLTYGNVLAEPKTAPEIIASCGESSGQAYYHHNEIVSKDEAGWSEDRVKDGSFLVQKSGDEYDVIYRDKLGLHSSKDSGALIIPTYKGPNSLSLVLTYPANGNTEVYNFQHLGTKDAEVSWTSTKVGTLIVKSGVFLAKCDDRK